MSTSPGAKPDYFAVLNVPKRPFLEAAPLKLAYQTAAATLHPDAPTGDAARFALLNSAYQCLKEPATRLGHLLDLQAQSPLPPNQTAIPGPLGDLFMQIAAITRQATQFRSREATADSALQKALLTAEKAGLAQKLELLQGQLDAAARDALDRLRSADSQWQEGLSASQQLFSELSGLRHELAYLSRWREQLRELHFGFLG